MTVWSNRRCAKSGIGWNTPTWLRGAEAGRSLGRCGGCCGKMSRRPSNPSPPRRACPRLRCDGGPSVREAAVRQAGHLAAVEPAAVEAAVVCEAAVWQASDPADLAAASEADGRCVACAATQFGVNSIGRPHTELRPLRRWPCCSYWPSGPIQAPTF